jgi:mono/diheme cytochrome c family protein
MAIQRKTRRERLVLTAFSIGLIASIVSACGNTSSHTQGSAPVQDIKRLFGVKCGICHGTDGKMQYAGAKDITVTQLTKDQIFHQIKFGKGTMPPQKDVLDDAEIMALTEYTMTLIGK